MRSLASIRASVHLRLVQASWCTRSATMTCLICSRCCVTDTAMVTTVRYQIHTSGQGDARDVTSDVAEALSTSGLTAGIVTVSVVGSTAAVTTIEFEPGAVADFNRLLETLAPRAGAYKHHERWGDDNGASHVRAALLGPSLTVPFCDAQLTVGTWQQIVLLELDTRPRMRQLVVQLIGE